MMTVQDLINALEEQPKGLPVTALIWPEHNGCDIQHVSVLGVARLLDNPPGRVVLRLASGL